MLFGLEMSVSGRKFGSPSVVTFISRPFKARRRSVSTVKERTTHVELPVRIKTRDAIFWFSEDLLTVSKRRFPEKSARILVASIFQHLSNRGNCIKILEICIAYLP